MTNGMHTTFSKSMNDAMREYEAHLEEHWGALEAKVKDLEDQIARQQATIDGMKKARELLDKYLEE